MESHISLFKTSRTPYWYLQWIDENGKKRQKSSRCKDKADALKVLTEFNAFKKEKQKPLLFSAFADQFVVANANTLSQASLILYKSVFTRFKAVCNLPLNRISPKAWDDYRAERLKAVSGITVNKELRTLRAALSTAVRWRLIDTNPFGRQPLCRIAEEDPGVISVEQFKSILGAIRNDRIRDISAIAFNTGMRAGEIVAMQWKNIDFDSGNISIRNLANFKTKTGKQRIVPMNTEVIRILRSRFNGRMDETEDVFPRMRVGFASREFKKAARLVLGYTTKFHFHSLRHGFCSHLLRGGVILRVVQTLAGHSTISTTEKYLHSVSQDGRSAVEILSKN